MPKYMYMYIYIYIYIDVFCFKRAKMVHVCLAADMGKKRIIGEGCVCVLFGWSGSDLPWCLPLIRSMSVGWAG